MSAKTDVTVLWRFAIEPQGKDGASDKTRTPTKTRAITIARDGSFFIVMMPFGEPVSDAAVTGELSFTIGEGLALAEQVLAGSQQAMTRPGAMRIIAATAKILGGVLFEPEAAERIKEFAGEGSPG